MGAHWTDDRVDCLKRRWAEGASASLIAGELGGFEHCRDGGRSAVIGKIHRLELPPRELKEGDGRGHYQRTRGNIGTSRAQRIVHRRELAQTGLLTVLNEPAPEPEIEVERYDDVIPAAQRRTLMELTDDTCRWPIGDPSTPEFFFCGARPVGGRPYCAHHCRIAYQPPQERRAPRPWHEAAE